MQQYSICKIGGRPQNDDIAAFEEKRFRFCSVVGDGLGAYAGGSIASKAAAASLLASWKDSDLLDQESLEGAIRQADTAVRELQDREQGSMKTTIVVLAVSHGRARWAHVGDSRLYHFRDGLLVEQTLDHSLSQVAVQIGDIQPEEIRFHPDRSKLIRALGASNPTPTVSGIVPVSRNHDIFLMCTDGFWEYVYENEMQDLLLTAPDPEQWLRGMEKILLSRARPDHDNYTASAIFL